VPTRTVKQRRQKVRRHDVAIERIVMAVKIRPVEVGGRESGEDRSREPERPQRKTVHQRRAAL
jgi:hypothetical protein